MTLNQQMIDYLAYFHGNHDYFHCHDILEEHWKTIHPINKQSPYVAFIQLAVGFYHYRAGNLVGAKKLLKNAIKISLLQEQAINQLGVNQIALTELLMDSLARLEQGKPFQNSNIPISDQALLSASKAQCIALQMSWQDTATPPESIRLKHITRDRTEVIETRQKQLLLKKQQRASSQTDPGSN